MDGKMEITYKSAKSESTFTATGNKERAFLVVTGEASTKAKVTKEVARIRVEGENFDTVAFIARQFAATH